MNRNLLTSFLCLSLSISSTAFSCSRVVHVDSHQGTFVGRNMDWFEDMNSKLVVYPRGLSRNGFTSANPLEWTSQYGSIVTTSYDIGATDGMNEKGLAIHALWLNQTDYGTRDPNKPGISLLMVTQFYLDNFKSVDEAVRFTENTPFQIIPFYHPQTGRWIKIHAALEDASGDSAIIEYIDGHPQIYHDKKYTVLTNDPVYSSHLENLKQYIGFGGDKPLPGTSDASDRFVRATYHELRLPTTHSPNEAAASVMSLLHNVGATFTQWEEGKIHTTIWRTIADLSRHVYYFNSTKNLTTVYVQLDQFSLEPGSPVMKLDLTKQPELSGDVTNQFVRA
jgi:choloylglycine hydrolase